MILYFILSDTLPIQPQMNGNVGSARGQDRGQRAPAIHTVKEDPNMPDSDVIVRIFVALSPIKIFLGIYESGN